MKRTLKTQEGAVLLEALIAVIIFSIGILGLVALLARTTAGVTDTRQRDEVFLRASNVFDKKQISVDAPQDITEAKNLKSKALSTDTQRNLTNRLAQFDFSNSKVAETKHCKSGTTNVAANTNHITTNDSSIYTNTISYGVKKAGETNTARNISFCAYYDGGPARN